MQRNASDWLEIKVVFTCSLYPQNIKNLSCSKSNGVKLINYINNNIDIHLPCIYTENDANLLSQILFTLQYV